MFHHMIIQRHSLMTLCEETAIREVNISSYFSLFFYEQIDKQLNLIRPLFSFESPYFSLKQMKKINENYSISFEEILLGFKL